MILALQLIATALGWFIGFEIATRLRRRWVLRCKARRTPFRPLARVNDQE